MNQKPRQPINKNDSLEVTCKLLCEGDVFVLRVLWNLASSNRHMLLLALDDMNMRGKQIFEAFMDYCDGSYEKFTTAVAIRDKEMVKAVNKLCPQWIAVERGGAPR